MIQHEASLDEVGEGPEALQIGLMRVRRQDSLSRHALVASWYRLPFRKPFFFILASVLFFTVVTVFNVLNTGIRQPFFPGDGLVTCDARTDVVFLKTHKCASSSVQNVLLRYGDKHNLTFVLPSINNYFGHPEPFNRLFVPDALNRTFNILTHHTRYNRPEMDLLMPQGTVYITIVRSPIDLLESLYAYYNLQDYYGMDLDTMSRNRTKVESALGQTRYYRRVGLNQMSFDLGFNFSQFKDRKAIREFCRKMDSDFDLVMVYERMEESLVLMADLLCWPLEDVVVFRLNARKDHFKKTLNAAAVKRLQKLSIPDVQLYQYFTERFEERVQEFGVVRMSAKVAELKQITKKLFHECVEGQVPDSNATDEGFNARYVVRYKLRNRDDITCQRMLRLELTYTEFLRKKQNSPLY